MKRGHGSLCPFFYKTKGSFNCIRICSSISTQKCYVFYKFAADNVASHLRKTDKLLQIIHGVLATVTK